MYLYTDKCVEDPIITNMERTGYTDGKTPTSPTCPVCGEECETAYFDRFGRVVGCENCMDERSAWDVDACFDTDDERAQ